ncbi:MAG: IPT/TIG domain-containing protein, partial [Candidatus Coatesbacteria bacterium]
MDTTCGPEADGAAGVVINGVNLAGLMGVLVGGAPVTVTGNTATTVTVTIPAGTAGPRDVVVITCGGSGTLVGGFTYTAVPTITTLGTTCGPAAGGTTGVVINGTNLANAAGVTIGGAPATITRNPAKELISTVAGTGTGGYNGDGIAATKAQINASYGVAVDGAGNAYIADSANNRIRKVTVATGQISTVAGTGTAGYNGEGTATSAQINTPFGLAVDGAGNLYIADRTNARIRKVTAGGGISTVAGTGTAGYNGDDIAATKAQIDMPCGVAVDLAGNIYFADRNNNRIRKVTVATGQISTVAGTGTAGYNGDGIAATTAQLNWPYGVALDPAGNLYLTDRDNQRIRKVDVSSSLISTVAGTGTAGYNGDGIAATTAQVNLPFGVAVDRAGNLYIADSSNYRTRKVDVATGLISTVAGTGVSGYNGDGIAATMARIGTSYSVAVDGAGNMYIGDSFSYRVRKVSVPTTSVTVTTPAGTAGAQDVVVTTCGGSGTKAGGFTYADVPTITVLDTNCGPLAGGTTGVVINGTNLSAVTAVTIGGAAAAITGNTATTVTVTTPAGTVGPKDVVVTTCGGVATQAGGFTYSSAAAPAITTLGTTCGPVAGGTAGVVIN